MRERSEHWLRLACLALAVLLLGDIGLRVVKRSPLSGLRIPELPTLTVADDSTSGGKGTNQSPTKATGGLAGAKGTNSSPAQAGTNMVSHHKASTNAVAAASAKAPAEASSAEEEHAPGPAGPMAGTNAVRVGKGRSRGTNLMAHAESGLAGTNMASGTNVVSGTNSMKGTNLVAKASKSGKGPNGNGRSGMGMPGGQMGGPGMQKPIELPPAVLARIDRMVDSELMGPVFHPMPSGLLGIVGNVAFLRAPSGQTGMVKEGDSLGEIKLLRIGTNRVLVEEEGQKKELMIFEGLGGQSLLPNEKEKL